MSLSGMAYLGPCVTISEALCMGEEHPSNTQDVLAYAVISSEVVYQVTGSLCGLSHMGGLFLPCVLCQSWGQTLTLFALVCDLGADWSRVLHSSGSVHRPTATKSADFLLHNLAQRSGLVGVGDACSE